MFTKQNSSGAHTFQKQQVAHQHSPEPIDEKTAEMHSLRNLQILPAILGPSNILRLQRAVGNQSMKKVLKSQGRSHVIQRMRHLLPVPVTSVNVLSLYGVEGVVWKVQTDQGNWVSVWTAPPGTADTHTHFCHGHSLGTYNLYGYSPTSGEAMLTILADEYLCLGSIEEVDTSQVGVNDIVVWKPGNGNPLHSARITHVDVDDRNKRKRLSRTKTLLTSKNGAEAIQDDVSIKYISTVYPFCRNIEIYRRR